jgi:Flp pilus assembly protein TadG
MPLTPLGRVDRPRTRPASGQVLVVFALGLLVLLGAAAVTIDLGMWLSDRRTLQNAADAGAQAGVSELLKRPITDPKRAAAIEHALRYVNAQLGLGLTDALITNCAASAASDPAGNGLGPEDCDGA